MRGTVSHRQFTSSIYRTWPDCSMCACMLHGAMLPENRYINLSFLDTARRRCRQTFLYLTLVAVGDSDGVIENHPSRSVDIVDRTDQLRTHHASCGSQLTRYQNSLILKGTHTLIMTCWCSKICMAHVHQSQGGLSRYDLEQGCISQLTSNSDIRKRYDMCCPYIVAWMSSLISNVLAYLSGHRARHPLQYLFVAA